MNKDVDVAAVNEDVAVAAVQYVRTWPNGRALSRTLYPTLLSSINIITSYIIIIIIIIRIII